MEKEATVTDFCDNKKCKNRSMCGPNGAVYGLGFIGAVVYFIQNADTLWMGVIGFFKALGWPAFLVYKLFEFLS
jgi:hypothetical protein